ncbi:hypothetical protein BSR29_03470 [Boudabousia liubingyangii]|uniref:Ribosome maturation factor RimP n=1 Tax=Boudabousia liubingyangii TaxID=1921764 RepID=A0A1Q5PN12_9ACTO|nr:hypothetical protein [Boudabousia liubingyangii]OKL48913.1 hypothetical protein BSR29_03470 [Boudabousia liubingyangii]
MQKKPKNSKVDLEELKTQLLPLVEEQDLVIENLKVTGGHQPTLVIDLDLPDGPGQVPASALEAATRAISKKLDEVDPFPGAYFLEVGTAGVGRELNTPRLWRRTLGLPVTIKLQSGKGVKGILTEVDDEYVTVDCDGKVKRLTLESIKKARSRADITNIEE